MKRMTLPYGVQDYLPDECYHKNLAERRICDTFSSFGYERIETPALEYSDLYAGVVPMERMFKLTDNDGGLLVLRPDTTLQVCRMAAKMRFSGVKKLYYTENSFEYLPNVYTSRTREFAQAGVELLGESGADGDVEVITLAIEAFLSTGLKDFLIEIGDVRFFKCIMRGCGLDEADAQTIRTYIDNKDQLGLEVFLQRKGVDAEFKEKFLLLPSLFGKSDVLDAAGRLCGDDSCAAVLDRLRYVSGRLHERGYGKYISFDLGLLRGLNYYSGLVIKGLAAGMGLSVLDGGRYDDIGGSFRPGMHAVGFAIGIKRLLVALDADEPLTGAPPCEYAYANFGAPEASVQAYVRKLRAMGKRVTECFAADRRALTAFARENGIGRIIVFTSAGAEEAEVRG